MKKQKMLTKSQWQRTSRYIVKSLWPTYDGTVATMATETGMSWITVDRLVSGETKEPRFSTIERFCWACGVAFSYDMKRNVVDLRKAA